MNQKITFVELMPSNNVSSKKWSWDWYVLFLKWFFEGNSSVQLEQKFQYLCRALDNNSEFRQFFIAKWVQFFDEVQYDSLWIHTFSGESDSFFQELLWAINQKFWSSAPQGSEVSFLVDEFLRMDIEVGLVEAFDQRYLTKLMSYFPEEIILKLQARVRESLVRSIYILFNKNVSDLYSPLYKMDSVTKYQSDFVKALKYISVDHIQDLDYLKVINLKNIQSTDDLINGFKETGVSLNSLFKSKKIKSRLQRIKNLLHFYETFDLSFILLIFSERKSFYSIRFQMFHYASQLIEVVSSISAETGDHYVSRSRDENKQMFYKACGGGFITAFTVLLKTLTSYIYLAPFVMGLLYSLNYAISFVVIYLLGFALATKQPAAMAAHLAHQWQTLPKKEVIKEISYILKSQITAVVGNVGVVIPFALLISWVCWSVFGQSFMTPEKATAQIKSMSLLGMTPFYAFLTGFFLWFSTFMSGVADNFFKVHQLDQGLLNSSKIFSFLNPATKRKWILFIKCHFGALVGNITLGFILGLVPILGDFLGLPLDVRHVTLSSGALAAAVFTLGTDVFYDYPVYLAILGVLATGVLNLFVSFVISLTVAEKSNAFSADIGRSSAAEGSLLFELIMQKIQFWKKKNP